MLIEFRSEGGFAHFPGRSRPIEIDTAQISMDEAGRLKELIGAAQFFDLPAVLKQPAG